MTTQSPERHDEARLALMQAAERLFAAHGVRAVGLRQISKEASNSNTAAVHYYFGTKAAHIAAMVERHRAAIGQLRADLSRTNTAGVPGADLRHLVEPVFEHLAGLGASCSYARAAQLLADPVLAPAHPDPLAVLTEPHAHGSPVHCPDLSEETVNDRLAMTVLMVVHAAADHERTRRTDWRTAAARLVDVLDALWQAPDLASRPSEG